MEYRSVYFSKVKSLLVTGIVIATALAPVQAQRVATTESLAAIVSSARVTLDFENAALGIVVQTIAKHANLRLSYEAGLIPHTARVTMRVKNVLVEEAFQNALQGTGLVAQIKPSGNVLIVQDVDGVQSGTIVGKVTHGKTKQPVAGATVLIDDEQKGAVTGEDGTFRILASVGEHVIRVRAMGFVRQAQRMKVEDGKTVTIDFGLEPSASILDEVVVTGTVVATERKAIPTPITVITAEDIQKRGITRVEQLFRGEVPGVLAIEQGTQPYFAGATPSFAAASPGAMVTSKIYARGASTLSGDPNPLKTYVDGVEMLDPSYVNAIDPNSIERIEIIAGPQAATIYGSGAMGGVMQIFTKKGTGRTSPDLTLSLRYGVLENSLNSTYTPAHNDMLSITGGSGAGFTYSGNVSYNYTGQWQPGLFNRLAGASIGAVFVQGPVSATGSVSTSSGENGTFSAGSTPRQVANMASGEWQRTAAVFTRSSIRATSASQTVSFGADYRPFSFWQHHMTVGRNENNFESKSLAPRFSTSSDTMLYRQGLVGQRTTMVYNTSVAGSLGHRVSSSLTVGATGSRGNRMTTVGSTVSSASTSLNDPSVNLGVEDKSWGGYGNWQVGLFERLYLTLGVRGESSPTYGREHRIDWAPRQGATYTIEMSDLSLKLLTSYGRATRAPVGALRDAVWGTLPGYDPSRVLWQEANPGLTPEYSRGPEGGFELYYGNVGSLTINHYNQTVTNLIQSVMTGDSTYLNNLADPTQSFWARTRQNVNISKVRQIGWEATGSLNLGALSLKGTWSWNDSRITYWGTENYVWPSFYGIPTHTGNVTASYARGGSSITVVTNIIGTMLHEGSLSPLAYIFSSGSSRLRMYTLRGVSTSWDVAQAGYMKSDLTLSQRLTPWATFTLNVTNLGNSSGSEGSQSSPALGRQTFFGVSLRHAK